MKKLICAVPEPGCAGTPRGLFYSDTPEGNEQAAEFARTADRPGWGVFECVGGFHDDNADLETFTEVLRRNGWRR